jgi:signal transduction histidine kinase
MNNLLVDLPIQQPLSGMAMHAFMALASETRPEKIPTAIARCACHAILGDICYLLSTPENGKITCFEGFNRVKEEITPGTLIPIDFFVEVDKCYQDGKPHFENDPATLNPTSRKTLAALGLVQAAPYCLVPLSTPDRQMLGALLLISPYSGRIWTQNDIVQLQAFADGSARILKKVLDEVELEDRMKLLEEQAKPEQQGSGKWIVEATGETAQGIEKPDLEGTATRSGIFTQSTLDLTEMYRAENDLLLYEIDNLKTQIQQLATSTSISAATEKDKQAQMVLEQIRTDLHDMLSPLSAITGYHDLLASESIGSLTTMQQKFLERIRSSAERLHTTIDQLDQLAKTGKSKSALPSQPQTTSLQKVIEESFSNHRQLIHDRNLEVKMLTPDDIPLIQGNYHEIQPVVNNILKSLLSITPNKSNIQSRLSLQVELDGKRNVLWKAATHAETDVIPGKELDEFAEYLQENVFNLAERLNCQLWMDAAIHTERQVNLLFAAV